MKISGKERYAVTAMLDLALKGESEPVTLDEIAANHGVSASYLEQIFAKLRGAGLVRGVRGPGGGYYLGRPASKITIAEILDAIEGIRVEGIRAVSPGSPVHPVASRLLWDDLDGRVRGFLDGITLGGLVERGARCQTNTYRKASS